MNDSSDENPKVLKPEHLSPHSLTHKQEWAAILLLAAIQFCHILDFVIMMPLGPAIMKELSINTNSFGVLVSSYSFAAAAMGFITSFFIDKIERRKALLFLFCGFIISTIACGFSNSYSFLIIARILAGCFGGVVNASVFAIAGELVAPARRGQAMGILMAAFSVSSVLGIPVGLAISEKFFWNAPFLALGMLSTGVCLLILFILPKMSSHLKKQTETHDSVKHQNFLQEILIIAKYPGHFRSFLLISTLIASGFCIIPYLATYLVHNVGLKNSELALMYMCSGIGTIVSSQVIGRISDKMGHIRTLTAVSIVTWIPLLVVVHSHKQDLVVTLVMMTAFTMFVSGRAVPTMAIVTTVSDPLHRGGFMSLFSSIQACALGLASLLGGYILTENADGTLGGFPELGYISIGFSIVTLLIAVSMKPLVTQILEAQKRIAR